MRWARSIPVATTTARRWRPAGALVENTIDDLYFWSNAVTLLCLAGWSIVLLQWRAAEKREVIAASLIAQLWNGRVSDRIEIERRTHSSIGWSKPITPTSKVALPEIYAFGKGVGGRRNVTEKSSQTRAEQRNLADRRLTSAPAAAPDRSEREP